MSASTRFVQQVYRDFIKKAGHDATCMPQLQITKAVPGNVTGLLKVEKHNANRLNGLHGGLICSLVDTMGSLALSSRGMWLTGVSTDISTTFIRGAGMGEEMRCEGSLINMGKSLAFTRVELFNHANGKLLATGTHTKYVAGAVKGADSHGRNLIFDESGNNVVEGTEFEEP